MKKPMNVTIEEELVEKLKAMAKKEQRNLSNMVEVLLTKAVEEAELK